MNSEEAIVQTVNADILNPPIRMTLNTSLFSTLQQPETYFADLGALDSELQQLVKCVVNREHFTAISVPVFKHKCK